MPTLVHRRVTAAREGTNPNVIATMASGFAVLGDFQFFRGYSLLLPDPVVDDLNALTAPSRTQFLDDMVRLGDALIEVTGAVRMNYSNPRQPRAGAARSLVSPVGGGAG